MRLVLALLTLASPLAAWEFTPDPICTLRHDGAARVEVTYDGALYAIVITRSEPWDAAETFGMAFAGGFPLSIGTARHSLSQDGRSLTVTDTGFGNVLNGLEFNQVAEARSGNTAVTLDLAGAADPVRAFRACRPGAPSV